MTIFCRMTILSSREHSCIHPQVSVGRDKNEECRRHVKGLDVSAVFDFMVSFSMPNVRFFNHCFLPSSHCFFPPNDYFLSPNHCFLLPNQCFFHPITVFSHSITTLLTQSLSFHSLHCCLTLNHCFLFVHGYFFIWLVLGLGTQYGNLERWGALPPKQ